MQVLKQCPDGPDSEALPFPLVKHTKVAKPAKVVLEYLQSGYLVKTGCSTRDVRVKRWVAHPSSSLISSQQQQAHPRWMRCCV